MEINESMITGLLFPIVFARVDLRSFSDLIIFARIVFFQLFEAITLRTEVLTFLKKQRLQTECLLIFSPCYLLASLLCDVKRYSFYMATFRCNLLTIVAASTDGMRL